MLRSKRILIFTLILLQFTSLSAYILKTDVLSSGATKSSSSGYILQGTLTELTASSPWLTSSGYKAIIGFWHPPYTISIKENYFPPKVFKNFLYQNTPNPAFRKVEIRYSIAKKGHVQLILYNALGQKVKILVNQVQEPGEYQVIWNIRGVSGNVLPQGVYFYRLKTGDYEQTRRMIILR